MKNIKYGIPLKTAAVILSFVTAFIAFASVFCAAFMFEKSFYARSRRTVKVDIITDMLYDEAYRIADNYIDINSLSMTDDFDDRFTDSNLYCRILISSEQSKENVPIVDNMVNSDAFCSTTVNVPYTVNTSGDKIYIYDSYSQDTLAFDAETAPETTVLNDYSDRRSGNGGYENPKSDGYIELNAEITLAVKKSLPANDKYSLVSRLIDTGYSIRYGIFLIILLSVLCTVILWIYLFCAAGRSTDGSLAVTFFDRIPFDFLVLLTAAVIAFSIFLVFSFYTTVFIIINLILLFCIAVIVYFCVLCVLLNFASQVKKKRLVKGTLCYRLLRGIYRLFRPLFKKAGYTVSNLHLVLKAVLICAVIAIAQLFVILAFTRYDTDMLVLFWIIESAVIIPCVIYTAVCLVKLKRGGEEIAGGNLDYKIDTTNMFGDFKRFGESLNNINEGMQAAVNEKMKSERMKTELITNVSHDIKTPLTSIINYADLIRKEDIDNVRVKEYIAVLERQSNRLKKLIEDLVEASKASSGVLKVSLEKCNVCVLLAQATGEYEERFEEAGLKSVVYVPEKPIYIMADGRYLWRVFDNLMNNICKYTQPDTRVYINLEQIGERAVITFKNVSKYPLNISSDELMERFVRGDSSRSTEGSGLGLSIARSLTELQNGSLNIAVDGDLFKVMVSFPIVGLS